MGVALSGLLGNGRKSLACDGPGVGGMCVHLDGRAFTGPLVGGGYTRRGQEVNIYLRDAVLILDTSNLDLALSRRSLNLRYW